eukprot:m.89997 g.89997  ORF g.89997 m.89997 type:complete len:204 (+) comp36637_c0_seq1:276-887(+)
MRVSRTKCARRRHFADLGCKTLLQRSSTVSIAEQARETVKVNFTAVLNMTKSMMPLLRPHSRVVNVSSQLGKLKNIPQAELRQKFASDSLEEGQLVELMSQFIRDAESGVHIEKGWPTEIAAYRTSKIGLCALTKIHAKKLAQSGKEDILVNACCPGWVRTDMGGASATKSSEQGAETPLYLALLPQGSPSGKFFFENSLTDF